MPRVTSSVASRKRRLRTLKSARGYFGNKSKSYRIAREAVMTEVRSHFKPEFLNRIDDIVIFKALQLEEIVKIVKLQIDNLNRRLEPQNIKVELTKKAYEYLADKAYDPLYGARPLKRVINNKIENPLAKAIISGQIREGGTMKFTDTMLQEA